MMLSGSSSPYGVFLGALAPNPIRPGVYESIILSGTGIAEAEYGRLPWLALSVLGGHTVTSNAASEGCHSIAQLIMSDLQTQCADFHGWRHPPDDRTSINVSVTARRLLSN